MGKQAAGPKDPTGLFKWFGFNIQAFAWINAIVMMALVLTWFSTGFDLFGEVEIPDSDPLIWLGLLLGLLSLFGLLFLLIAAVSLVRLNFRLVNNLRHWSEGEMMMGPIMVTVWYFVPLANLVMPFHGVKQIWRATFEDARLVGGAPSIVRTWWSLFLLGALSYFVVERAPLSSTVYYSSAAIVALVQSASYILMARIYRRISLEQSARVRAGAAVPEAVHNA